MQQAFFLLLRVDGGIEVMIVLDHYSKLFHHYIIPILVLFFTICLSTILH